MQSSTFSKALSVVTLVCGLGLLAFGAISHNPSALAAGAAIVVPVVLSEKWGPGAMAKLPEVEKGLEVADQIASKLLPLVPGLPPATQAVIHTVIGDMDSAAKALEAANGGAPAQAPSPAAVAAQAGADAAKDPAKAL